MSETRCGLAPESASVLQNLNVGTIFHVHCQGDEMKGEGVHWELRADDPDGYKIKLLKISKVSEDEADLALVSYRVGKHDLKAVQIVSPEHSVVLGDFQLNVVSVQDPKDPVKEPYGPRGPISVEFPFLFFAIVIVVVCLGIYSLVRPFWMKLQRKRLMKTLPALRMAQPEQELYRTLRVAKKLSEIDEAYRLFLARSFNLPAHKWDAARILKDIRKNHPKLSDKFGTSIREILVEIKRAEKVPELPEQDLEGIRDRVRDYLDQMDREKSRAMKGLL